MKERDREGERGRGGRQRGLRPRGKTPYPAWSTRAASGPVCVSCSDMPQPALRFPAVPCHLHACPGVHRRALSVLARPGAPRHALILAPFRASLRIPFCIHL
eukprot:361070-Chlamydomonas_euryale.AAC.6